MVKKAVIPAAGLGTNFLPATKAQSKEMLPIIVTPAIQYVVEEAIDSGIDDILIIVGKEKRAIEDHFDRNPHLESVLKGKELSDQYHHVRRIGDMANIHYIRQKETNGLGDALRYARQHIGDEPFALLLGDTIINSVIPVTQQLIDIYEQYRHSIVAVESVTPDRVSRFGIVGGKKISETLWSITELIEKPAPDKTPSDLALAGRYILTPEIFSSLDRTVPDKNNDIQLTDALQLILEKEDIYAYKIEGKRYDLGTIIDYLKTIVDFSINDKDVSKEFIAYLKEVIQKQG